MQQNFPSKRKVYRDTYMPQETRKISNKHANFHVKELAKEQTKPNISRRKEIINFRAEINNIETKKKKERKKRSMKPGAGVFF